MSRYYTLNGHTPVLAADVLAWGRWFETAGAARRVALTELPAGVQISTVFLGNDHSWSAWGPPLLFETMVFGGVLDQEQERYSTWEAAEAGHAAMVARVRSALLASE